MIQLSLFGNLFGVNDWNGPKLHVSCQHIEYSNAVTVNRLLGR